MAKVEDCPGFETFGADVKAARKARRLARKALAEMVGIEWRYLANIENKGTIPSLPVVIQLIKTCGLPVERYFNPEVLRSESEQRQRVGHKLKLCPELKSAAPVPARWQKLRPSARPGYVGHSQRRELKAVAGVLVQCTELVHFSLWQGVQRFFPVTATGQLRQVVDGLVAETGLAESVQPVPFHIVKGVFVHLLTPDLRESEKIKLLMPLLSLAATLRPRPAPTNRRKQQISPGRLQTHRAKEEVMCS